MAETETGQESTSGITPSTTSSEDGGFFQALSTKDATSDTQTSDSLTAMVESAMDKAEQNLKQPDETHGKRQTEDSSSPSEQAATGDSTPSGTKDTPGSGEGDGTSGQPATAGDSTPESEQSLTPPDNWPEDRRKEFSTLPDNGKALLMSIHKDMERGLKQSFDKLATDRKAIEANYGLEETQLKDLAQRYQTFQNDPVAIISQLAEEAGVEVFFNQQTEEIPEFDSQADLVRWLQDQSRREARQAAANEAKSLKEKHHQENVKRQMEQEFAEAYKSHPDLPDHKDAVIKYISGYNLPVEMAYRLATYEGLTGLAQNGNSLKSELDKTKAELEKLQKLATMPPGRADGRSQKQHTNGMDMFEAAYTSAEKVIGRQ